MATIMILGSGGFGCALSIMCEKMGHKTVLYSPFEEELSDIRRDGEHKRLLPGAKIPPTVELTSDCLLYTSATYLREAAASGVPLCPLAAGTEKGDRDERRAGIRLPKAGTGYAL